MDRGCAQVVSRKQPVVADLLLDAEVPRVRVRILNGFRIQGVTASNRERGAGRSCGLRSVAFEGLTFPVVLPGFVEVRLSDGRVAIDALLLFLFCVLRRGYRKRRQ